MDYTDSNMPYIDHEQKQQLKEIARLQKAECKEYEKFCQKQQRIAQEYMQMDLGLLKDLYFSDEQIALLSSLVEQDGAISTAKLISEGFDAQLAADLKYMYSLSTGRVCVNNVSDLSKHLRRMFGRYRRIGLQDLAVSSIHSVPKVALVAGIKEPFAIYNSKRHAGYRKFYRVKDVSQSRIIVCTKRKPALKWGTEKKVPGVLEILEEGKDGLTIAFSKDVCRLCNRFIVVASLRRPEFHHGMYEMLCIEGTTVYVFAQTLKPNDSIRYNKGTQRVYSYGFLGSEINRELERVFTNLYSLLCGVLWGFDPANQDFLILPEQRDQDKETDANVETYFDNE